MIIGFGIEVSSAGFGIKSRHMPVSLIIGYGTKGGEEEIKKMGDESPPL